eukprot:scaffold152495_cov15-Prasinocladus_malaysianus.AAC.1
MANFVVEALVLLMSIMRVDVIEILDKFLQRSADSVICQGKEDGAGADGMIRRRLGLLDGHVSPHGEADDAHIPISVRGLSGMLLRKEVQSEDLVVEGNGFLRQCGYLNHNKVSVYTPPDPPPPATPPFNHPDRPQSKKLMRFFLPTFQLRTPVEIGNKNC